MASIYRRLPKVNSLVGSARPARPRRPFGAGILPAYEDGQVHYGSLGLPTPLPTALPVHQATTQEQHYEAACVAVTGGRAEWLTSRPTVVDGPYFDEAPELPLSAYHEVDDAATGDIFWSAELEHLESLLQGATPLRRAEIERRIAGVVAMLAPVREAERLQAESLERQLAESWVMDQIEAGAERFDGRDWEEQELCRVRG